VLVVAAALWRRRAGSLLTRVTYSLVAVSAGLFAWFLSYWNLLGFHLG